MTLRSSIIDDRVPEYELVADVLRPLDPTEHNLERLNARARGSCRVYHALTIEGPLWRSAFERAVDALTDRHPLLRVRIVRRADGALCFAPTRGGREDGTARIPVSYLRVDDLACWPSLVEADMNAGAIASGRGPLFAMALIEPPGLSDGASGRRVVVLLGHHAVSDGTSSIALLQELLEELAAPRLRTPLGNPALSDPFCLDCPVPELGELELELRQALDEPIQAERRQRLAQLQARLEGCEASLLAKKDANGRFPTALKSVQGWLSLTASEQTRAAGVLPEVDLGASSTRYEHAATMLLQRSLTPERTRALRRATKEHGLTLHATLGAAISMAHIARHTELSASQALSGPMPDHFALASAVSLRKQLVPTLEPSDVRMAVDVVICRLPVAAGERFWGLARQIGAGVTQAVATGRALSSWFRTERRDLDASPPGVPLPLVSNLGQVALAKEYGPLRVHEFSGAMTTHGSFQIAGLFFTFDDRLCVSFYAETPTVSRTSFERFAARVLATLDAVGTGEDPTLLEAGRPPAR